MWIFLKKMNDFCWTMAEFCQTRQEI